MVWSKDLPFQPDAVLVVGDNQDEIEISTSFVSAASKVFKAMFSLNFSEGQELSVQKPKRIRLEEDNAVALRYLCAVFHHRLEFLPLKVAPVELYNVAIAANKYDCAKLLKYPARHWMRQICNEMPCFPVMWPYPRLLAASFVFDDSEGCEVVSHLYTLNGSGAAEDLDAEVASLVPERAFRE